MSSRRRPQIQIVAVGKVRPPFEAAARRYEERIGAYAGLRVDEVAGEPLQRGEATVLAKEAERVRTRLLPDAHLVVLDRAGRAHPSSEALATWLEELLGRPRPVALVVGGALGVHPGLAAEADERLALGPLTMPHQLARVVLAEQLYRALCARAGHPYPH